MDYVLKLDVRRLHRHHFLQDLAKDHLQGQQLEVHGLEVLAQEHLTGLRKKFQLGDALEDWLQLIDRGFEHLQLLFVVLGVYQALCVINV